MIDFDDIPFCVSESILFDCQYGQKYYKQKPKKGKKVWLQGTRKVGCMAHIEIKSFKLFPEYAISSDEKIGLPKWNLRCLREGKLKELKTKWNSANPPIAKMKYYVSLPKCDSHSNHPIGSEAIYAQKMHPKISQKLTEMVSCGITDAAEVRRSLRYFVNHSLCKELGSKPHPYDRAFFPLKHDILNHICTAKRKIDLSKFDQENLRLKVEHWKKNSPTSSFSFRPFGIANEKSQGDENACGNENAHSDENSHDYYGDENARDYHGDENTCTNEKLFYMYIKKNGRKICF